MERTEFIKLFDTASDILDMDRIHAVVSGCLDRCHALYPQYERGHMNIMSTMEELAECTEAISRKVRGREKDNYGLLEEIGDVYLSILCVAEVFGITDAQIRKAINAKTEREAKRQKNVWQPEGYPNFMSYIEEKYPDYVNVFSKCVTFYLACRYTCILHGEAKSVSAFGRWILEGGDDGFELADAVQHAVAEARMKFGTSSQMEKWGLDDYKRYEAFQWLCEQLDGMAIRVPVMEWSAVRRV